MRVWFRLKDGRTLSGEYHSFYDAWARIQTAEKSDKLMAWGFVGAVSDVRANT